ncbi:MAG: WbqC family protein [Gammaproteobacteria bacterium]
MILTAHQPVYLPWLGLFHKIALADLFCYFDIAQYQTKDYNNRNKIKTHSGEIWLSVPVESKDHFQKSVGDIRIVQNGWHKKHFKSIQLSYAKAPFVRNYIGGLEALLLGEAFETLSGLNLAMLRFLMKILSIDTPIVKASDYSFQGTKSDLVLDMCLQLKASTYIFGAQGQDYADVEKYRAAGLEPYFQAYQHPTYRQLHGDFLPYMSVIDLLFNEGPRSREILLSGNVTRAELPGPSIRAAGEA